MNNPIYKWAKDLNEHFSTEDSYMVNKDMGKNGQNHQPLEKEDQNNYEIPLDTQMMASIKSKQTENNKCW